MRNIAAVLIGILISFLTMALIAFVFMYFGVGPFFEFATGNFDKMQFFDLAKKITLWYIFLLFPIIAFVTGLFSALIARDWEYVIGILCIVPLLIIFFDASFNYLLILLSIVLFETIGVNFAKRMKR
jgi:hypothetical protein